MIVVNAILSILVSIALKYFTDFPDTKIMIITVVVLVILSYLNRGSYSEGFGDADESRVVKYGDMITIWTWQNAFVKADNNNNILLSPRLTKPSEIPRSWSEEYFYIEDSKDPSGPGNRGPVKFGDSIYLRSWKYTRISALNKDTANVTQSAKRSTQEKFVIESSDISGNAGSNIKFGDIFYLKTWRKKYIAFGQDKAATQNTSRDKFGQMRIYDRYGHGAITDWARRGHATQSSNYFSNPAVNVIDGNSMTINHTHHEDNAWWQVKLPKDVYIEEIVITNRQDGYYTRLSNCDVIVMDSSGKALLSKHLPIAKKVYKINGINRIGRIVRIQLRGKNYLHISEVKVYGKGVDYSTLLENPVVSDLINEETNFTEMNNLAIYNEDMPYVGTSGNASITYFIKPSDKLDGDRAIMIKGETMPSPYMFLKDGKLNVRYATSSNNKQEINSDYKMPSGEWTHVAFVVNSGISTESGWLYGSFDASPKEDLPKDNYLLHNSLRKFYHVGPEMVTNYEQSNNWSSDLVKNMKYMGELSGTDVHSTMKLYINGRKEKTINLSGFTSGSDKAIKGQALTNNEALYIGNPPSKETKGGNFMMNKLKFFNYALTYKTIGKLSSYQFKRTTLTLIRGIHNTRNEYIIEPHTLPEILKECSINFWIFSERDNNGTKKEEMIFRKGGGSNEKAPAMTFAPDSNNVFALVSAESGKYYGESIKLQDPLAKNVWYHIALVLKDRQFTVYINGKLRNQKTLPGKVNYNNGPIKIGTFEGKIMNFAFSNYALNSNEVANQMGRHPDHSFQLEVKKLWNEVGCISNPFKDPTANSDWIELVKTGNQSKLEDKFKALKKKADEGDKKIQEQCFGKFASSLYNKLQNKDKLLKYALDKEKMGKKCLPIAPFECQNRKVNDFDIRTHRDFYKYSLTSKIIPCAQSASDINIENHPDFIKFQKQMDETARSLAEMKRLKILSDSKVKTMATKLNGMKTVEGVKKHPVYLELEKKLNVEQKRSAVLHNQQKATENAVKQAGKQSDLSNNPQYTKMAKDLKKFRKIAASKIADNMDMQSIRSNPLFKDIVKDMISANANANGTGSNSNILALEESLGREREQLNEVRSETLMQLENTKEMASDIFQGISGMTAETINNIIQSKKTLSQNPEYQEMLQEMQSYKSDIKTHPEYQKLVTKLNQLSKREVDGLGVTKAKFNEIKIQASKCKALFSNTGSKSGSGSGSGSESGQNINKLVSQIPSKALIKIVRAKMKNDPSFMALAKNIVESKAETDTNFADVIKQAQNGKFEDDEAYQKFIQKTVKNKIQTDPVYRQIVLDMVKSNMHDEEVSSIVKKYIRIEDHPEYNKYAREMKTQCLNKSGEESHKAFKKDVPCFTCKVN
jgi:hypothetical protein